MSVLEVKGNDLFGAPYLLVQITDVNAPLETDR